MTSFLGTSEKNLVHDELMLQTMDVISWRPRKRKINVIIMLKLGNNDANTEYLFFYANTYCSKKTLQHIYVIHQTVIICRSLIDYFLEDGVSYLTLPRVGS